MYISSCISTTTVRHLPAIKNHYCPREAAKPILCRYQNSKEVVRSKQSTVSCDRSRISITVLAASPHKQHRWRLLARRRLNLCLGDRLVASTTHLAMQQRKIYSSYMQEELAML